MYSKISSDKLTSFVVLLFSSIGFSFGAVVIRLFSDGDALAYIINLQSMVVFGSFILQFGLRAASRVHIYNGRPQMTKLASDLLHVILCLLAIIGLALEIYTEKYIYVSLSSLLAMVTLRLTISVAKNITTSIINLSMLNFLVASGSSLILLAIGDQVKATIVIEAASAAGLLFMINGIKLQNIFRFRQLLVLMFLRAQSYQLGSCVIALFIFLLTQSAVSQLEGVALSAFSDALILSGFLVLLLSKTLLLVERKLYSKEANKLSLFTFLIAMQVLVSIIFSVLLHSIYGVGITLMFTLLFVLLSRTTAGYIVQYVEVNRNVLNYVSSIFFVVYFFAFFLELKSIDISLHVIPVIIFLSIGAFLLKRSTVNTTE